MYGFHLFLFVYTFNEFFFISMAELRFKMMQKLTNYSLTYVLVLSHSANSQLYSY